MSNLQKRYIAKIGRNNHQLLHQKPRDGHANEIITQSSLIYLEGCCVPVLYLNLNFAETDELWPHLDGLTIPASGRQKLGSGNKGIVFGALPPAVTRNSFCSFGAVANRDGDLAKILYYKYSLIFQQILKAHLPTWEKINVKLWKNTGIHSDYQLGDSIWTSGIINKNSAQHYHYDGLNVRNMLSAMVTLKRNISGGHLIFPEYELAFEVTNRSLIFFCGSSLLHGVSPLTLHENGARYSIVYYTTKQLSICDSLNNNLQKNKI